MGIDVPQKQQRFFRDVKVTEKGQNHICVAISSKARGPGVVFVRLSVSPDFKFGKSMSFSNFFKKKKKKF